MQKLAKDKKREEGEEKLIILATIAIQIASDHCAIKSTLILLIAIIPRLKNHLGIYIPLSREL